MQTGWPILEQFPQYGCISGKMNENKTFVSWSGGKDSSLACLRAMKAGCTVSYLLNMLDETGERERAHGTRPFLLQLQAEAMGIPLIQVSASWEMYELEFTYAVRRLKREGIERGVFGDIDLREHRAWVERVCEELEIEPLSGRHAEVFGRYRLERGAGYGDATGYFTLLAERAPEGWRIVHDHTSAADE